jgi:hypothetical protein
VLGLVEAYRRRQTPAGRYLFVLIVGSLITYVPYFFRDPRFMASAGMIELAFVGSFVGRQVDALRARAHRSRHGLGPDSDELGANEPASRN